MSDHERMPEPVAAQTSAANAAQPKLDTLEGLAAAPKPERTYDAITAVGEQAVLEELADARVVHVLAPDR